MDIFFDKDLMQILTPEEAVYVYLLINCPYSNDPLIELDFYDSTAYEKLYDYFLCEMPYGIAKVRTGDPDTCILRRHD